MPIDASAALGATIAPFSSSWDADDVILYHLGIGAGLGKPTDPAELAYTYEQKLVVLPSFGVVPAFQGLMTAVIGQVPGLAINPVMVLHGEQDLEIHKPIPTSATVEHRPRIASIYDKGKAALITLEIESGPAGDPIFTNRFTIFARGEGGFGGDANSPAPGNTPPEREPDAVVESPTMSHQALIYRLSGDKNPLHADPDFAKLGGFDTPILHGLCTYGIVCKATVDTLLGGDVTAVARYQVRFAGRRLPRRDGRHVDVARRRPDHPVGHDEGTGRPRPVERRDLDPGVGGLAGRQLVAGTLDDLLARRADRVALRVAGRHPPLPAQRRAGHAADHRLHHRRGREDHVGEPVVVSLVDPGRDDLLNLHRTHVSHASRVPQVDRTGNARPTGSITDSPVW